MRDALKEPRVSVADRVTLYLVWEDQEAYRIVFQGNQRKMISRSSEVVPRQVFMDLTEVAIGHTEVMDLVNMVVARKKAVTEISKDKGIIRVISGVLQVVHRIGEDGEVEEAVATDSEADEDEDEVDIIEARSWEVLNVIWSYQLKLIRFLELDCRCLSMSIAMGINTRLAVPLGMSTLVALPQSVVGT